MQDTFQAAEICTCPSKTTETELMQHTLYGIFGGTFDPVHNGHLQAARDVMDRCRLGQVILVPSHTPPHRPAPAATPAQRYDMVQLAVLDFPGFCVDDIEYRRASVSYTWDTVQALKEKYPDHRFCLIAGEDALSELELWHRWQNLLEAVHFIVIRRPGWVKKKPLPAWWQGMQARSVQDLHRTPGGRILELSIPPVQISATEIRDCISRRMDVGHLVPESVWRYINCHKIYLSP